MENSKEKKTDISKEEKSNPISSSHSLNSECKDSSSIRIISVPPKKIALAEPEKESAEEKNPGKSINPKSATPSNVEKDIQDMLANFEEKKARVLSALGNWEDAQNFLANLKSQKNLSIVNVDISEFKIGNQELNELAMSVLQIDPATINDFSFKI